MAVGVFSNHEAGRDYPVRDRRLKGEGSQGQTQGSSRGLAGCDSRRRRVGHD